MVAKRSKKWGKKGKLSLLNPSYLMNRTFTSMASRVDYLKLLKSIAKSKEGRPWMKHFESMPAAWPFQDELSEKAIELCVADLEKQGAKFDVREVSHIMDGIRCRYDQDMHRIACAGLTAIFQNLFEQKQPGASLHLVQPQGAQASGGPQKIPQAGFGSGLSDQPFLPSG